MRRNSIFYSCLIFFMLATGFTVYGESNSIAPFTIPSARFSALGGNHAAAGDSFHSLFTNPASFVDVKQFSAAEVSTTTYGPVFEMLDVFLSNQGSLENVNISGLVGNSGFAAGFDLVGPVSLGWVGNGLGIGIFNRIKTDAVVSGTTLRPAVSGEVLLVGGYSFRMIDLDAHWLDAGFLGKGFFRGAMSMSSSILDALSLLEEDPLTNPINTYLGLGLDLGVRYTYRSNFTLSLVCFDVFSPALVTPYNSLYDFGEFKSSSEPASYTSVARRLDFGMRWRIGSASTNLTLMADYHDILDLFSTIPRNPILNVGLGVEMTLLNVLSLRAGIADALPSVGLGLNLKILTLDMAIFGRELGLDPGRNPVYGLGLGILFRY